MFDLGQASRVQQNAIKVLHRQPTCLRVEWGWVEAVYQCGVTDIVDRTVGKMVAL